MSQPYKVIILDDEHPARDLIKVFVNRIPDLTCVATCSNAMKGLEAIQQLKPDLLFLDIQMPEMSGMELMSLPLNPRPEVILTTAYPDYALSSYEFSVLDYLVKPIAFERFVKAVVKFRERMQIPLAPVSHQLADGSGENISDKLIISPETSSIWLREEKRLLQIPYQEILYVEALKDYVKVYLNEEMILTHLSIGKAEKLFTPPQFVRIHRSFIVQLAAIRQIDGNTILLTNGKELQLGPLYREELRKYVPALG
ncbi:LytTR family DNA-binding domain-containing protein [Spirosoma terrae]|uniref:Response regulator transcription factor n=1 Tax=Spirosoma terrae TaxID=1968276 RepID=A0A6L9LAR0_9BACT|nr:LytTR family DNA-binding domain-containing protein [Spirosoma terrae]NDU95903.1 response regulator transcription factor [Spirosoma terrae]